MSSFREVTVKKKWRTRLKDYLFSAYYQVLMNFPRNPSKQTGKSLIAIGVGSYGEKYVQKMMESVDLSRYDFMFFVWDDKAKLEHPIFSKAKIIREKGIKFQFLKKYLTPDLVAHYDYLFLWDDDIDIMSFSFDHFLDIFKKNKLEMAQPALTAQSYYAWELTMQSPGKIGRMTDFVEIMIPVFTADAWLRFRPLIHPEENPFAWGIDFLARSFCGYRRMGIIDAEAVYHTKDLACPAAAFKDLEKTMSRYKKFLSARKIVYSEMV